MENENNDSVFFTATRHPNTKFGGLKCCTGSVNPSLSEKGRSESRVFARSYGKCYPTPDVVVTSSQKRTKQAWDIMQKELGLSNVIRQSSGVLNDRDYGDLTGLTHSQMMEQIGKDELHRLRTEFDYSTRGVETLRSVRDRTLGYYQNVILPDLLRGKNVFAFMSSCPARMSLNCVENLPLDQINRMSLHTAEAFVFEFKNNTFYTRHILQKPAFLQ